MLKSKKVFIYLIPPIYLKITTTTKITYVSPFSLFLQRRSLIPILSDFRVQGPTHTLTKLH
jgi:hypothetical protein